jgi:hypothetical protein
MRQSDKFAVNIGMTAPRGGERCLYGYAILQVNPERELFHG